jgi:hypothetical protein
MAAKSVTLLKIEGTKLVSCFIFGSKRKEKPYAKPIDIKNPSLKMCQLNK